MNQHQFTTSVHRDLLTFYYDTRTQYIGEIEVFLASDIVPKLQQFLQQPTYVVLGGDGLFVYIAKEAHRDGVAILGINFGTKGFLLHDQDVFENTELSFVAYEYPILHADLCIGDEHTHGYAFNEVYVTRAGDASSIRLSVTHAGNPCIDRYIGDGLMVATPAGSTGWSASYHGQFIPHDHAENALTPVGGIRHSTFAPMTLPDKGRIRINNDITRIAPIDILVDNHRIISMESRAFELTIERASRGVRVLIETSYLDRWHTKISQEQSATSISP